MLSRLCGKPWACTLEPTLAALKSTLAVRMLSDGRTAAGDVAGMCGVGEREMMLPTVTVGAAVAAALELLRPLTSEGEPLLCGLNPLGAAPSRLALSPAAELALSAPTMPMALSSCWPLLPVPLNDEGLRPPLFAKPDACTVGDAAAAAVAAVAAATACARAVDARRTRSITSMAAAAAGDAAEDAADGDAPDARGDDAGAPAPPA